MADSSAGPSRGARVREGVVTALTLGQLVPQLLQPGLPQAMPESARIDPSTPQQITAPAERNAPSGVHREESLEDLAGQLADERERELEQERQRAMELGPALAAPDIVEDRRRDRGR